MWRLLSLLLCGLFVAGAVLWWIGAWRSVAEGTRPPETALSTSTSLPARAERRLRPIREQAPAAESMPTQTPWALPDPILVTGCNLTPLREEDVASQVDGVFESVAVDLGSPVRRGQVLGQLDSTQVRLLVDLYQLKATSTLAERLARAKYDEANAQVQDDEQIRRSVAGGVAESQRRMHVFQREGALLELKKAAEDREAAELELKKARHELEQHAVRSDLDGEVVKLYKRPGEAAKALEPAFRVADTSRLRVEGLCPVQQAELIRPGTPALLEPERPSRPLTELRGHTASITSLAVSPDGHWLASAGEDHTVMLWNGSLGVRRDVVEHPAEVYAVALAARQSLDPPGAAYRLLTGAADGLARLWFVSRSGKVSGQPIELAGRHEGPIRAVAFSADGRWCGTGGEDKRIGLWDAGTGKFLYFVQADAEGGSTAHRGPVTALHFTPDGFLVSAARDNTVKVWKPGESAASLVNEQAGRTGDVAELGVSADGRRLLFDHGEELRILDRDRGDPRGALRSRGHGHFQSLALFSPGGRRVLTASADGRVQLWKVPAEPAQTLFFRMGYREGFSRSSLSALGPLTGALAPGGALLSPAWLAAAASPGASPEGDRVRFPPAPTLWSLDGQELRHLATPDASAVTCGAFAPDESVLFTGGSDRVIRVWAVPPAEDDDQLPEARVTFVGGQVESGTGLVRIRAELDNPREPSRRLRPGTHATLVLYPETASLRRP